MIRDRILILGANGMLGGSIFRYLTRYCSSKVVGSVRTEGSLIQLRSYGFDNLILSGNLTSHDQIRALVYEVKPSLIINCVGIIKQVDQANNPSLMVEINSLLPHRLARLCTEIEAKLIHFSTDCVFTGVTGGYIETDIPDAADLYGRSKLLGEITYDNHLTLRTSLIGHEVNSANSLVDWFLTQTDPVNGFKKAIFSGFPTIFIAEFINKYVLEKPELSGLYHLSAEPIDKFSLLHKIKEQYNLTTKINPSSKLVIDRSLNSEKLRKTVNFTPPNWDVLLKGMYNEHKKYFRKA